MRIINDHLIVALRFVSGLALLVLMTIVVIDVVGREFFASPLRGITELSEIVLAAMIFFGYPALALRERHIRVDLLALGAKMTRIRRVATGVIGALLFGAIGWRVWEQAERVAGYGDRSPMLQIPSWAVLGVLSILAWATAGQFLIMIYHSLTGRPGPAEEKLSSK